MLEDSYLVLPRIKTTKEEEEVQGLERTSEFLPTSTLSSSLQLCKCALVAAISLRVLLRLCAVIGTCCNWDFLHICGKKDQIILLLSFLSFVTIGFVSLIK